MASILEFSNENFLYFFSKKTLFSMWTDFYLNILIRSGGKNLYLKNTKWLTAEKRNVSSYEVFYFILKY